MEKSAVSLELLEIGFRRGKSSAAFVKYIFVEGFRVLRRGWSFRSLGPRRHSAKFDTLRSALSRRF